MNKKNLFSIISIIINAFIVTITTIGILSFFNESFLTLRIIGAKQFIYYTTDSNILLSITSVIVIVLEFLSIYNKKIKYEQVFAIIRFASIVGILLTLLTVFLFLIPSGAKNMLTKSNLYFHLINPLLALVSYLVFENTKVKRFKECVYSIIPMGIYEIIYFINVMITKTWTDFYGFTKNGLMILFIILMPIGTYLIGLLIYFLKKNITKKGEQNERI